MLCLYSVEALHLIFTLGGIYLLHVLGVLARGQFFWFKRYFNEKFCVGGSWAKELNRGGVFAINFLDSLFLGGLPTCRPWIPSVLVSTALQVCGAFPRLSGLPRTAFLTCRLVGLSHDSLACQEQIYLLCVWRCVGLGSILILLKLFLWKNFHRVILGQGIQ